MLRLHDPRVKNEHPQWTQEETNKENRHRMAHQQLSPIRLIIMNICELWDCGTGDEVNSGPASAASGYVGSWQCGMVSKKYFHNLLYQEIPGNVYSKFNVESDLSPSGQKLAVESEARWGPSRISRAFLEFLYMVTSLGDALLFRSRPSWAIVRTFQVALLLLDKLPF